MVFPVAVYLLTVTVFIDTSTVPETVVPYRKAGVAVSYGMFGAIVASLNSFGQQLAADFEADRYIQYRSLPLVPSADLAGRAVAGREDGDVGAVKLRQAQPLRSVRHGLRHRGPGPGGGRTLRP